MLTALLPSRMAPISRSRSFVSRSTARARLSPAPARWCMRGREAAVSAVSDPEKKPDSTISRADCADGNGRLGRHGYVVVDCGRGSVGSGTVLFGEGAVEQCAERLAWDVLAEKGLPDAARQYERDSPVPDLLVVPHALDQRRCVPADGGEGVRLARQPDCANMGCHPRRVILAAKAKGCGEPVCEHDAIGHRLAMQ